MAHADEPATKPKVRSVCSWVMDNWASFEIGDAQLLAMGGPHEGRQDARENASNFMQSWISNKCEDPADKNAWKILFAIRDCTVDGIKSGRDPVPKDFEDVAHVRDVYLDCKARLAPWINERGKPYGS